MGFTHGHLEGSGGMFPRKLLEIDNVSGILAVTYFGEPINISDLTECPTSVNSWSEI